MTWCTSYHSEWQQAVVHEKGLSAFTYMKSGVPQGSILGPTLFLLFINDLPLIMNYCYSDFFADDANLHTHDNKYVLKSVSFGSKKCTIELKLECAYFLGQTS